MLFKGVENQTVELRVTNYQFPEITDQESDSNWLNIYIDVKSKMGHWQTVDPSLMTGELKRLIGWFRNLSENKPVDWDCQVFTEPNLQFDLIKKTKEVKEIRISFWAESRPVSFKEDLEYHVDCEFTNEDLSKITDDLEAELNKYPSR